MFSVSAAAGNPLGTSLILNKRAALSYAIGSSSAARRCIFSREAGRRMCWLTVSRIVARRRPRAGSSPNRLTDAEYSLKRYCARLDRNSSCIGILKTIVGLDYGIAAMIIPAGADRIIVARRHV